MILLATKVSRKSVAWILIMPASSLFLIMIRCRRWFFVLRFGKITSMVPMTLVLFS